MWSHVKHTVQKAINLNDIIMSAKQQKKWAIGPLRKLNKIMGTCESTHTSRKGTQASTGKEEMLLQKSMLDLALSLQFKQIRKCLEMVNYVFHNYILMRNVLQSAGDMQLLQIVIRIRSYSLLYAEEIRLLI